VDSSLCCWIKEKKERLSPLYNTVTIKTKYSTFTLKNNKSLYIYKFFSVEEIVETVSIGFK
jgi:hypothetical protein